MVVRPMGRPLSLGRGFGLEEMLGGHGRIKSRCRVELVPDRDESAKGAMHPCTEFDPLLRGFGSGRREAEQKQQGWGERL